MMGVAHWPDRQPHVWSSRTLRLVLLARVVWNASFTLYLVQQREDSVAQLVELFIRFAVVDGALALLMAVTYMVAMPRRLLWLSPAADAATRAVLVIVGRSAPGVMSFPLTLILYLALIATFTFGDGLIDVGEAVMLDHDVGRGSGWQPLAIGGTVSMAVGLTIFLADANPTLLRVMLGVMTGVHAASYASGLRHVQLLVERGEPAEGDA